MYIYRDTGEQGEQGSVKLEATQLRHEAAITGNACRARNEGVADNARVDLSGQGFRLPGSDGAPLQVIPCVVGSGICWR